LIYLINGLTGFPSSPVGKTASGESGQNNGGLVRGRGIGNFAEAQAMSERSGAKDSNRGSALFAGQRPGAAKKPFCRLDFWLLCIKTYGEALLSTLKKTNNYEKLTALPRQLSGPIISVHLA
jgi:hypothetical protein